MTAAVLEPAGAEPQHRSRRPGLLAVVAAGCAGLLAWRFVVREDSDMLARVGLGYALGIVGLTLLVFMLAYSLRKRVRWLRGVGRVKGWFELHMIVGLLAPTALLLHCNFELGSLNAAVALACTLAVAGSGIAGRFLYVRIHRGLLDERRVLDALRVALRGARGVLAREAEREPQIASELDDLESFAFEPSPGLLAAVGRQLVVPLRARRARRRCIALLAPAPANHRRVAETAVLTFISAISKAVRIRVYEWFFGLWHAVHVPLCVLLFGSAAIHVVAVHMY